MRIGYADSGGPGFGHELMVATRERTIVAELLEFADELPPGTRRERGHSVLVSGDPFQAVVQTNTLQVRHPISRL